MGEGARKTRRGEIFVMQIRRQYFFFINIENVFFRRGCIALKRGEGGEKGRGEESGSVSFLSPPLPSSQPFRSRVNSRYQTNHFQSYFCLFTRQTDRSGAINRHPGKYYVRERERERYPPWQPCAIFLPALTINPVKIRSKK